MDIIGHAEIRNKLNNLIFNNKVGHAYLFVGRSGIGKKLVAMEFAQNMMCLNNLSGIACGECQPCKTFSNTADFAILKPENKIIKVDEIRKLGSEIYLKPIVSIRKCFIIDDADLMNENAQNALLKILEEPPLYATIILIAENKEKLLGTIKSRVTEIDFSSLTEDELRQILKNDVNDEILKYAMGSVDKAIELSKENNISLATSLVEAFKTKKFLDINQKIEIIKSDKTMKSNISSILELVILVCYGNLKDDISLFVSLVEIINEANKNIQRNANVDLALDNMIVQICF